MVEMVEIALEIGDWWMVDGRYEWVDWEEGGDLEILRDFEDLVL